MQHGQQALDALPEMDEQVQQFIEEMIEAGLLERGEGGGLKITPRMVRGMQHKALLEIFRSMRPGTREGHMAPETGRGGERLEGTKPYEFGDPLSELALGETMRNAIRRVASERRAAGGSAVASALPLGLSDRDFELYNVEAQADTALCVLIDLSGSMARYGRHVAAKRIAMGLRAMVRRKFPNDTIDYVGFASVAERIREDELALIMPKPITTRAWDVRVRVPLSQAEKTHPHMTNLHHALRLARQTLARRGAANKQIFIITDGQPTAHLSEGGGGTGEVGGAGETMLNLVYPPCAETQEATLREVLRCRQAGLRMSAFALIEEYHSMEWVGFIDQLARLARGVAFYCAAGDLGATIMESYLSGKRERQSLA